MTAEWRDIDQIVRDAPDADARAARIVDLTVAHHQKWRGLRASLRALIAAMRGAGDQAPGRAGRDPLLHARGRLRRGGGGGDPRPRAGGRADSGTAAGTGAAGAGVTVDASARAWASRARGRWNATSGGCRWARTSRAANSSVPSRRRSAIASSSSSHDRSSSATDTCRSSERSAPRCGGRSPWACPAPRAYPPPAREMEAPRWSRTPTRRAGDLDQAAGGTRSSRVHTVTTCRRRMRHRPSCRTISSLYRTATVKSFCAPATVRRWYATQ